MKKNFTLIFFCFLAGLFGANVTPILTGAGKLIFPETSPSASLSASGGQLTIAAGGTNKNILLQPSGTTGAVGISTTPGAGNQLDVAGQGWVNASSGYKVANNVGYNFNLGVRNAANTGTCTMTFFGGILINLSGC